MMRHEHKRLRTLFSCLIFSLGLLTLVSVSQLMGTKWVNADDRKITCNGGQTACSIPYNGSVTIEWSPASENCLVYPNGWKGEVGRSMDSSMTETKTYSLYCYDTEHSSKVTVTVGPKPELSAVTDSATDVGNNFAVINGTVSAVTPDADVRFDFGTSAASLPVRFDVEGAQGTKVSYFVNNLSPGREYFYRVVIVTGSGTATGEVRSFRTAGGTVSAPSPSQPVQTQTQTQQPVVTQPTTQPKAPAPVVSAPSTSKPSAKTVAAGDLGTNMATLKSLVLPGGLSTRAWFEYGNSESLGRATGKASVGAGRAWTPFNLRANLPPNEPFYYRVVAENAKGISRGAIVKVSAPGDALFAVEPGTHIIKAGELAQFKATYDPDGIGTKPAEDVTKNVVWLSDNAEVAAHEIGGGFRAKSGGDAIITAVYNPMGEVGNIYDLVNLRADGAVTVEGGASQEGSNNRDVFLGGSEENAGGEAPGPSSGKLWAGIGVATLVLVVVGAGTFFMLRKLRF